MVVRVLSVNIARHQVILMIFSRIIHSPAVFQGIATHPTEILEPGLVHLVWLLSHLHALIYVHDFPLFVTLHKKNIKV